MSNTVRKICLDRDGYWYNTEGKRERVSPTVGDLVDTVCSEDGWKTKLYILKLGYTVIFGTEDFVRIVVFKPSIMTYADKR